MRKLDKHTARATARVEREAPDSKDTSQRARRDQSGTSRRRESKQPVDVGTKRAAAGRLRTGRGAAAVESPPPHTIFMAHLQFLEHLECSQ